MWDCLSLPSHVSTSACPNFKKYPVHVTCGIGSVLIWQQCNTLCNSIFVDDVMFYIMDQIQLPTWSLLRSELFTLNRHVTDIGRKPVEANRTVHCAPGAKSDTVDCLVRFHANCWLKLNVCERFKLSKTPWMSHCDVTTDSSVINWATLSHKFLNYCNNVLFICRFAIINFNDCYNRSEREKMMAKTEMDDLQNQLEQMTKSKVISRNTRFVFYFAAVISYSSRPYSCLDLL